jgi:hypothetical protein
VERLNGRGHVVIFIRPQNVRMAHPKRQRDGKERREEQRAVAAFHGHGQAFRARR